MDKRYYKEYYTLEREHWWFTVRLQILEDYIKRKVFGGMPLKILNVGVATGATSTMLAKFGEVTSLEYDKDCCEFLREELGMEVINGSVLELPFDDSEYDLVCAFDVIEHVEDDVLAVKEMKRVCKAGGDLFITVPALMSLWSEHDVVNHHFRRYKLDGVRQLFKKDNNGKERYSSYFNSKLFLPIYIFRQLSKILPKRNKEKHSGSDFGVFNNGFTNKLLAAIFKVELYWLRISKFPIGVSILYSWKKD
jgi:SAM-dependent methyltransferase